MKLRIHQEAIEEIAKDIKRHGKNKQKILAYIVPGGGKSWLPMLIKQQIPRLKIGWFVPRLNLRRQAAEDARDYFHMVLNESENTIDPSRGQDGFVATHQSLTMAPDLWKDEFKRHPYLLVIDEIHHAKINKHDAECNNLARAIGLLDYKHFLMMTGTLDRHDNHFIYGMTYKLTKGAYEVDKEKSADYIITYSRKDALEEKAIVPMNFCHYDGIVEWKEDDEIKNVKLSESEKDDYSASLFTALSTDYARGLLESSLNHWNNEGDKLLIVCRGQTEAKDIYHELKKTYNNTYLAVSDEEDSLNNIKRYRKNNSKSILVTCMMAYEGLDVKGISHICSLTHIRSIPWIYQMLARAWRVKPGKHYSVCHCPDDPRMNYVIEKIKAEQSQGIKICIKENNGENKIAESNIIPINAEITDIRKTYLDIPIKTKDQMILAEMLRYRGHDPDSPEFKNIFNILEVDTIIINEKLTYKERVMRTRKRIMKYCNNRDAALGNVFGTSMKELHKAVNYIKFKNMTEDQLLSAEIIAHTLWERTDAADNA